MVNRKTAGLAAAGAFAALLAAAPAVQAQMMAPLPPPPPEAIAPPGQLPSAPVPAPMAVQPQPQLDVFTYSDSPKADPGDDPANWSARRNVVESQRYEQLLRTNPAFLRARIRKECPFAEPEAFQRCVATFQ
jgi:hypothetical protein